MALEFPISYTNFSFFPCRQKSESVDIDLGALSVKIVHL
jgi:hypothetical protein